MNWVICANTCAKHNLYLHSIVQPPLQHEVMHLRECHWCNWLPENAFKAECLRAMNLYRLPCCLHQHLPLFYQREKTARRKWLLTFTSKPIRTLADKYSDIFVTMVKDILKQVETQRAPSTWCQPHHVRTVVTMETIRPEWKYRVVWSNYMVAIYHDIVDIVFAPWIREEFEQSLLLRYLLVMIYDRAIHDDTYKQLQHNRRQVAQLVEHPSRGIKIQESAIDTLRKANSKNYKLLLGVFSKKLVLWLAELLAHVMMPLFPTKFAYPVYTKPCMHETVVSVPNDVIGRGLYATNHWHAFWRHWTHPTYGKFYPQAVKVTPPDSIYMFMLDILTRHTNINGHIMFPHSLVKSAGTFVVDMNIWAHIIVEFRLADEQVHQPFRDYQLEAKYAEMAHHVWDPSLATILCASANQRIDMESAGFPTLQLIT